MNSRHILLLLITSFTISCGKKETDSASTVLYPVCISHDDCSEGQFCGIECWTGGCGENADVEAATMGQYCQPCDECRTEEDSITGNCNICL